MKKKLNLILFSIILSAVTVATKAQNNPVCFMEDENGNSIDISYLCQPSDRNSISNPQPFSNTTYKNGVYTIPIKRRHAGIPVIDVKINEQYTFEMMLDTGASLTVLTPIMAETMKIKPEGSLKVQTPSDSFIYMPWSQVQSISTGDVISKQIQVAISPSLDIGLLGQNFFGIYDITIKSDVIEFRER
jgi:aspartyl protease family protein